MNDTIKLELTADEAEILLDALESDLEGYEDAAKDARANFAKSDVATFEAAATRIKAVMEKVRRALTV